jgi:hypothetical protein
MLGSCSGKEIERTDPMRWKLALAALAFPAIVASGASAQNPNSDWSLGGGTGIGRHATGFSGTQGDPAYTGTSRPPTLRDYGPGPGYGAPGAGSLGGPIYTPRAPSYAPPSGAPLEYYTPGRR